MVDIQLLNHIPDLLAIHQHKPATYPFFLSSANCGGNHGRYSILFAFPQQRITCSHEDSETFIKFLEAIQLSQKDQKNELNLPFLGGWFFYFSYEYAQFIETHLTLKHSDLPIAFAQRIPAGFIVDNEAKKAYSFCESEFSSLANELKLDSELKAKPYLEQKVSKGINEENECIYLKSIGKTKQYIKDGDIFQANLSRLWQVDLEKGVTASQCFKKLMEHNPSPFSALVDIGEATIISSSPERLVKINQGVAETRPIAGTHPRGENQDSDEALSQRLLKHPKEQAEHIMLIDLERNDLGRVCQPGSIKVDEMMVLESYQHVHHIVSNVIGEVKPSTNLKQLIHAVFPGGTITGCPKVRCMEIIAEFEQSTRDCYTGSVGYMNHNGNGDFNILIRTLLYQHNKIRFRAGAGIVADSNPQKELDETRHKAKGMVNALS
ncbi:MAG: aminodeoxychorismate synthase component I [Gammaproteobacteria bacterium]|nr:aminodeoxychorismate synthase component I [Gammaproteobacteria bacterium]